MILRLWIYLTLAVVDVESFAVNNHQPKTGSSSRKPKRDKYSNNTAQQKQKGYELRSSGKKIKRTKPPKWETEGDLLFSLHSEKHDSKLEKLLKDYPDNPQAFLKAYFDSSETTRDELKKENNQKHSVPSNTVLKQEAVATSLTTSTFLWGDLSVGPILAPKLKTLFEAPMPIQSVAFASLAKKGSKSSNVVIASPTGTGKTLSYLLPIIATTKRDVCCSTMIVTPTLELAFQIQRVVDQLWDLDPQGRSTLYVVTPIEDGSLTRPEQIQSLSIAEIKMRKTPIIAGTPKSLASIISYCQNNNVDLLKNLSTVVLDEADRLLQTELAAREDTRSVLLDSPTVQLIEMMERMKISFNMNSKNRVRLVCASATVGRTLRRQIMELTGASSVDNAADLVTADSRTGKDEEKRKISLLPQTILHYYIVCPNFKKDDNGLVDAILKSLSTLPPAPALVFPGNVGVIKMADSLNERGGMDEVYTLRDNFHLNDASSESEQSWSDTPIFVVGEKFSRGLDIPSIKYVFLTSPPATAAAYAHLAGRTGRAGSSGTVFTLVQDMTDAQRLASLSNSLGICFYSFDAPSNEGDEDYSSLSVIELKKLLRERGLKVGGKKSELIERLQNGNSITCS